MQSAFDIIIIGAGIAGLSVAAQLANSYAVAVLEREEHPGYHATGRSAAIYLPTYGPPAIQALTRASGDFFHTPPQTFTDQPLLSPRETMMLATRRDADEVTSLLAAGMSEISKDQALARLPVLNTRAYDRFLLDAGTMDIDVSTLLAAHRKAFRRDGGALYCTTCVTALTHTGNVWQVATPAQSFSAPIVINAAGAWAQEIAELAGATPIALEPMRRSAALVDLSPHHNVRDWPLTATADESLYFRPIGQKLMISPADKTVVDPHDAWADDMELARAMHQFHQATGIEVKHVEHSWAGLRTFAADGNPVIGYDPRQPGFFWLAGQGGYGIQTSPAAARLAAALIARKAVPTDITSAGLVPETLSPARFA